MKTEKILSSIFLIGLLFKILSWPYGSVLIIISASIISTLYFVVAFYLFCDKNIKNQKLSLSITSGIFLSIIPLGVLFKIMYWPGAQNLLLIGSILASILYAIIYYFNSKANHDLKNYYKNMLTRTGVLTVLATFIYIVPLSALLEIQYREDPELVRIKTLYYSNPENLEYKKQHDEYLAKKDSL